MFNLYYFIIFCIGYFKPVFYNSNTLFYINRLCCRNIFYKISEYCDGTHVVSSNNNQMYYHSIPNKMVEFAQSHCHIFYKYNFCFYLYKVYMHYICVSTVSCPYNNDTKWESLWFYKYYTNL